MKWWLNVDACYYTGTWWDYLNEYGEKCGVYRLTEHGWWDVRTIYYEFDPDKGTVLNEMLLPASNYTEDEIRKIVEAAYLLRKGELTMLGGDDD
jgi:hypothetical protein